MSRYDSDRHAYEQECTETMIRMRDPSHNARNRIMKMTTTLDDAAMPKECPFCGGDADTWQEHEGDPDTLCATCPDPDCVGSQVRTAIEYWNIRADKPHAEAVRVLVEALQNMDNVLNNTTSTYVDFVDASVKAKEALSHPAVVAAMEGK